MLFSLVTDNSQIKDSHVKLRFYHYLFEKGLCDNIGYNNQILKLYLGLHK